MEERDRIRELRKNLGLTMEKFGERLGVAKSTVSGIESGARNVTEQMRLAICREYGVSEAWLRTGEGEMFKAVPDGKIDELCDEYGLDDLYRAIVAEYVKLSPKGRAAFKEYVKKIADDMEDIPAAGRQPDGGNTSRAQRDAAGVSGTQQSGGSISGMQRSADPASGAQPDAAKESESPASGEEAENPGTRAEIERKVEAYRRQLEIEASTREKSSGDGSGEKMA